MTSKIMRKYCKRHRIHREFSSAYAKQQSGTAESTNDAMERPANALIEHSMSHGKDIPDFGPKRFWAYAADTVCYTRSRAVQVRDLHGKTPWEKLYGEEPDNEHLRCWGCVALPHLPDHEQHKWCPKTGITMFVGYEWFCF